MTIKPLDITEAHVRRIVQGARDAGFQIGEIIVKGDEIRLLSADRSGATMPCVDTPKPTQKAQPKSW